MKEIVANNIYLQFSAWTAFIDLVAPIIWLLLNGVDIRFSSLPPTHHGEGKLSFPIFFIKFRPERLNFVLV